MSQPLLHLIVDELIEITWNMRTKSHYIDKGYLFTKIGDTFVVNSMDLPPSSKYKIKANCELCGAMRILKRSQLSVLCKDCALNRFKNKGKDLQKKAKIIAEMRRE